MKTTKNLRRGLLIVSVAWVTAAPAQWVNPLQMEADMMLERWKERDAQRKAHFNDTIGMIRKDDEEKREEYEAWKSEVIDYIREGDMATAARKWEAREDIMWNHRESIGGDCETWIRKMRRFWKDAVEKQQALLLQQQQQLMRNAQLMNQQMNNIRDSAKAGAMQGLRCPRCGDSYYGQISCPKCSGAGYGLDRATLRDKETGLVIEDIYY